MRISRYRASMARLAGVAILAATPLIAPSPASAYVLDRDDDEDDVITVTITIENDTDHDLKMFKKHTKLERGEWQESPPRTIDEAGEESFTAESEGKSGVKGQVAYRIDGSKEGVLVLFKNPKKGEPEFDCEESKTITCDLEADDDDEDAIELTVNVSD